MSGIIQATNVQTDNIKNTSGTAYNFIKQVKQSYITTQPSTTSTSFVTSGLAQAITPSSTSSKILLNVVGGSALCQTNSDMFMTIYRDSTNLGVGSDSCLSWIHNDAAQNRYFSHSFGILDSPNSTSAITYTVYWRNSNSTTSYFNQSDTGVFLTVMEVAG